MVIRFAFAAFALALSSQASAFCVYNYSDKSVKFSQDSASGIPFKGFSKTVDPGGKACCNYKNRDCNMIGGQTAPLGMFTHIKGEKGLMGTQKISGCGVPANGSGGGPKVVRHEAGGWIEVSGGKNGKPYTAVAFTADGKTSKSNACSDGT
ncbi:hypothetical protein [Usitatibacter palustris]|uniref:Uncharacterized protein n=1 Tax=Usitatibacter palustris TaxID=2732487 RepID=A0A6M4H5D7_9PROT|nr:hypothetical protein [Usitatibacter palustris]QJR13744.1 hypothetical protein DSM104440_00534 [Usitatibacter palustris]